MKTFLSKNVTAWTMAILVAVGFSACELNKSSSHDFGNNDPNTILCIGDSITYGYGVSSGQSYPAQLAAMLGRRVINAGRRGELSGGGRARFERLLDQHKPGYALILYGANDVSYGRTGGTTDNLRQMIRAAKARQIIPIVATLTPTDRSHSYMQSEIANLNPRIRQVACEERSKLADLEKAFDNNTGLLLSDGLHPSAEGLRIIALTFLDQI